MENIKYLCHLRDTGRPPAEAPLGRADFAVLPRRGDLVSFHLAGTGRQLCEVLAVEHAGVHESTFRDSSEGDGSPDFPLPPAQPATVLHIQVIDPEAGADP